jgi:hypothetical protein
MNAFMRPTATLHLGATARSAGQPAAEYWGVRIIVVILFVWAASFVIGFRSGVEALTLVGFGAALIGIRGQPVIGILGIGILCTLDPFMQTWLMRGGILRYNSLNYFLIIVILLSISFVLRLGDPHTRLLQLFLLLLGLELAISPSVGIGIIDVLSIVVLFGLLVYFARACQEEHMWYWLGLVTGVLAATGGLVYFLQRANLPLVNPNAAAWFPLTGILGICLSFPFVSNHKRGQTYLTLLATINFIWVLLTASRGDILIAICCLLFLVAKTQGISRRTAHLAVAVLLGFLVSTQFTDLQENALKRLNLLFNDSKHSIGVRTSGRSDIVVGGWYIFIEHPFGVGTGGFGKAYADLGTVEGVSFHIGKEVAAHTVYIKTLAENGIPGLALLLGYILSFAIIGWHKRHSKLLPLGLLTTAVLGVAFLSTEYQNKGLWFLAAGVTTILYREDILIHLRKTVPPERITSITKRSILQHNG